MRLASDVPVWECLVAASSKPVTGTDLEDQQFGQQVEAVV